MVNWISLSTTTGNSGETQITLTVSPNTEYSSRTTTLNVTTQSKHLTDNIVINQAQKSATGSMTFNPSGLSYTYEGGILYLHFTANTDWNVVSWPTWVGVSGDVSGGTGSYVWGVTALQNRSTSDLDSQFTFYCGGNYFTIPVHQDAYAGDYSNQYLTFEILSGGTIITTNTTSLPYSSVTYQYRVNKGDWNNITTVSGDLVIGTFDAGDKIYFKGNNPSYNLNKIGEGTAKYKVYGNIMSLIYGDSFQNKYVLNEAQTFRRLFYNSTGLTDASNLVLPATTLTQECYYNMFGACINLKAVPNLPATTMARSCYRSMFEGCFNLTQAPALPATNLADNCYQSMFGSCYSLTAAPALPATTLAPTCYNSMFYSCSGLTQSPALPATTMENNCYRAMFQGCSSLTSAPALPATTLARSCYSFMFKDCTSLTSAPALPATTMIYSCYGYMFEGCTSLTKAPNLPASTLIDYCYEYMFNGCSNLNYIKCLATNPSTANTLSWGLNVAPTGTFVQASGVTGWIADNVNSIPIGWTVVDEDYSKEYLTFEILSGGTIYYWEEHNKAVPDVGKTIEYSLNGGEWISVVSSSSGAGTEITSVVSGDNIKFRGNQSLVTYKTSYGNKKFKINMTNCYFNVYGNIMSVYNKSNYQTLISISDELAFERMFVRYDNSDKGENIVSASNLVLPATTLAKSCYYAMFEGCSGLTQAPSILPATNLAYGCYQSMFKGCTALTTAPELPVTTLSDWCYYEMFRGCNSLNYIKCLATDISASSCTTRWLYNVAQNGTFVKAASMTGWSRGVNGIPTNWTVQDA